MPPTRTFTPAKAVKTERTHEENQERAYIAASRRSDRSLEARVESARRASEIHKRRTGRSLRVTEQDVINEEMYEEEDDDLPLHYRRLTAHLQTGSVDFNRRLAAYLTNQVAMRSAMDQMINNSYAQQYPNAPTFAHNNNASNNYSSPTTSQMPTNQTSFVQSPTSNFRSAPYPSPHQANFRNTHVRSNSVATPGDLSHQSMTSPTQQRTPSLDDRRLSMPTTATTSAHSPPETQQQQQHGQQGQSVAATQTNAANYPPLWQDHSMFTTTLPPESQQMLAPALDPNDPMTANLMAGSESFMSNPYFPWGNQVDAKGSSSTTPHPTFNGMSATLAPSALDMTADSSGLTSAAQSYDTSAAPSSGLDFNLSQESSQLKGMPSIDGNYFHNHEGAGLGSGQGTPGESFWDSYIQDGGWAGDTAAS